MLNIHGKHEDSPSHFICESCSNNSAAVLPPHTVCRTCLHIPLAIYVPPPLRDKQSGKIISEGYRMGVMSRGGKEVCTSATIPGHLNDIQLKTTGKQLIINGCCYD